MKKNEEKSAMGKKARGRPRKIVQTMGDGSGTGYGSSHDQYFPASASVKNFVGQPLHHPFRSKEVYIQGKEDENEAPTPIQNPNVSLERLKRKALMFLYSEDFNNDDLFSVRVDVEEDFTITKRAQKTSVASFKEMKSIMNPSSSRDVTNNVTTKCASSIHGESLHRHEDEDDDNDNNDDEIEVGANVAENTSTAPGLNDSSKTNCGLRDVKVDDDDDPAESFMHYVFGDVKEEGPDVVENVGTKKTSIARNFNVTGIANMVNNGPRSEDDEIMSSLHPVSVNVRGYNVKQENAPLVEKILMKYGDIGKNNKIRCANARGLV